MGWTLWRMCSVLRSHWRTINCGMTLGDRRACLTAFSTGRQANNRLLRLNGRSRIDGADASGKAGMFSFRLLHRESISTNEQGISIPCLRTYSHYKVDFGSNSHL
jgi:hypothetical protein